MFTTGETVGLAEWIIDDTSVVLLIFSFTAALIDKISSRVNSHHS